MSIASHDDPSSKEAIAVALATAQKYKHEAMMKALQAKLSSIEDTEALAGFNIKCLDDDCVENLVSSPQAKLTLSSKQRLSLQGDHWKEEEEEKGEDEGKGKSKELKE